MQIPSKCKECQDNFTIEIFNPVCANCLVKKYKKPSLTRWLLWGFIILMPIQMAINYYLGLIPQVMFGIGYIAFYPLQSLISFCEKKIL